MNKKKKHRLFPNSHKIKGSRCPNCNALLDGAEQTDGDGKPTVGDFSICAYCYQFLCYDLGLSLRKATKKEVVQAGMLDKLLAAKKKLRHLNRMANCIKIK